MDQQRAVELAEQIIRDFGLDISDVTIDGKLDLAHERTSKRMIDAIDQTVMDLYAPRTYGEMYPHSEPLHEEVDKILRSRHTQQS